MKRLLLILCIFIMIQPAFPLGAQGHQAVGEVARGLLTPAARAKISESLGNDDLGSTGTWLDDVRAVARNQKSHLEDKTEARVFNKQHPNNAQWHYVNLPVGYTIYAPDGPFSSPDDVVHAIGAAVDVFEGNSEHFTKIQALRILVHLVADVHQPFHSISGYFDCTDPTQPKLISDPMLALKQPNDRGGNQLYYTKTQELHHHWDTNLVNKLAPAKTPGSFSTLLVKDASIKLFTTPCDYHDWAAKWVSDSATEAIGAYKGLTFGPSSVQPDGKIRIETVKAADYDAQQLPRVKQQLEKAAVHLAQLLNSVRFK